MTNKYYKVKITSFKILAGRRQTNWLFTSAVKELNLTMSMWIKAYEHCLLIYCILSIYNTLDVIKRNVSIIWCIYYCRKVQYKRCPEIILYLVYILILVSKVGWALTRTAHLSLILTTTCRWQRSWYHPVFKIRTTES